MWVLIVNYINDCCNLICADDVEMPDNYDDQEEFVRNLGYDLDHIDWYVFKDKPTLETLRYDLETDDIYPIWC